MDWVVRVVWEPRWSALSRRFGGWRRKKAGNRVDFSGLDLPDIATTSGNGDSRGGGGGHIGSGGGGGGFWDAVGEDILATIVAVMAVIVAGALFWWLLLPLLLMIVDLSVVIVLLLAGVLARVLLRRPWVIEAVPRRGPAQTFEVVGWRNARREQALAAERIAEGREPVDAPRQDAPA